MQIGWGGFVDWTTSNAKRCISQPRLERMLCRLTPLRGGKGGTPGMSRPDNGEGYPGRIFPKCMLHIVMPFPPANRRAWWETRADDEPSELSRLVFVWSCDYFSVTPVFRTESMLLLKFTCISWRHLQGNNLFSIFTCRALVRNRTLMISCLCNVLFTGLQHDTTLDSLSALDREISLKNIHTYIT